MLQIIKKIMKKETKTKIIILITWIILLVVGYLLFRPKKTKILEDQGVDIISEFKDDNEYNLSIESSLDSKYSPLYTCKSDSIPTYLSNLAKEIDPELKRVDDSNFVRWIVEGSNTEILVYNIDSTYLNIYLDSYPEKIGFVSVERFISKYLSSEIKYGEIEAQIDEDTEIYTANRLIEEQELLTGFGYSDYYYIENGYLRSARILLADIEGVEYVAPLISDKDVLTRYINIAEYPKSIIIETSRLIELTPQTYEDYEIDVEYEKCLINDINPKLYFSTCNQNYIYYVYKVGGVCDITHENKLYTVPFRGFINAIEPEYVKTLE